MIKKILTLAFLSINIFIIFLLQLPFIIFKPIINRKIYLTICDLSKNAFLELLIIINNIFYPYNLIISGDKISPYESAIIICNHQTTIDWLYLLQFAYLFDGSFIKIILKKELLKIPIIGQAMQFFEFIFLNRKWKQDQEILYESCSVIKTDKNAFWILIFPEGTIFTKETKQKSDDYGKLYNLKNFENVLLPKDKGLNFCLQNLPCDVIYDLTIGYSNSLSYSHENHVKKEWSDEYNIKTVYSDKAPKQVHINCNKIKNSKSKDFRSEDFNIYDIFERKDKLLNYFQIYNNFSPGSIIKPKNIFPYSLFQIWLFFGVLCISFYFYF